MASYQPIHSEAVDDEFQSSENNDLVNLSDREYWALWKAWFRQAQMMNDVDEHIFSHGVMLIEPGFEYLESEVVNGAI